MTVGAVTSYSTVNQYRYFDTSISDKQIQDLLKKYSITPTGDRDLDLRELRNAMYTDAKNQITSAISNANQAQENQAVVAQTSTSVPWANLMTQVGLSVSGDFEKDYQAFSDKIFQMQMSATTPQDKANINQLVMEAAIVFVQPATSSAPSAGAPKTASGADILAALNKMYFFG